MATRAELFISKLLLFSALWLTLTIFVKPHVSFPLDKAILFVPIASIDE